MSNAVDCRAESPPPNMTFWYARFLVTPFGAQIVKTENREKACQVVLCASSSTEGLDPHRGHCSIPVVGMAYANDPACHGVALRRRDFAA